MNNYRLRRLLAVAVLCLFTAQLQAGARVGEKAPHFVLPDASGELVSLKDFRGQPLVLHFWATWCPYCKKVQPGLQAIADTHRESGLVLLGVSFREDRDATPQSVLEERNLRFRTLVEGDEVAEMYGARGTPTTVFIDRDGRIVGMTHTSDPNDPLLQSLTDQIL